jgi:hypothetical protein
MIVANTEQLSRRRLVRLGNLLHVSCQGESGGGGAGDFPLDRELALVLELGTDQRCIGLAPKGLPTA